MDTLPPEVLRIICTYLDHQSAANARFLSRNLSVIAAEFLVHKVRFHTSYDSLKRLQQISQHPIFSYTVKELVYEAALLADVGCRHDYTRHFELDHHGLERPREPTPTSSDRELRLYLRNKAKWTQEILAKYNKYRKLFDSQQSIIERKVVEEVLAQCIPNFPKLSHIDVDPVRRCPHTTSKRFTDEFGSDCASPLSGNYSRISEQFNHILLPNDQIIQSLRALEVNALSPSFFKQSLSSLLNAAFSRLTTIEINLRLTDKDANNGEHPRDCFHRYLSNGVLKNALASAVDLKSVAIGIETIAPIFIDASHILAPTTWPQLEFLSLSTVTSTQRDFMQTLKRQPKLERLKLAFMQLTQGSWPEILKEMRDQLKLLQFAAEAFLEDPQETWPMDLLNVPMYIEDFEEFSLSDAIEMYVTEVPDDYNEDEYVPPNPLVDNFGDFEEEDLVKELYGEADDMSFTSDMSEMSCNEILDDSMSDSDVSMPDLAESGPSS